MTLKIATSEIQAALDAYLAAREEEIRIIACKTAWQGKFREVAGMTDSTLVLATRNGKPVVVQQDRSGRISLIETNERDG